MSGTIWNNSQFNPESQTRGSDFQGFSLYLAYVRANVCASVVFQFPCPSYSFHFLSGLNLFSEVFSNLVHGQAFRCVGEFLTVPDPDGGSDPVQRDQREQSRFQCLKFFAIARDEHQSRTANEQTTAAASKMMLSESFS